MNKTVIKIKKAGRSPMYLLSAIMLTASALLLVVSSLMNFDPKILMGEMSKLGLPEAAASYMNYLSYLPVFVMAKGVLVLLTAIGMLMYFGESCSGKSVSCKGMSLIKAILIIRLVIFVVVQGLFSVGFIGLSFTRIFSNAPFEMISLVSYGISLASVLWIVLTVIYYRGVFKTIKSVKMTLGTGIIMGNISVYVIVINMMIAVMSAAAAVFAGDVFMILYWTALALSYLFSGIALISLRSDMRYIASKGSEAIE